MTLSNRSKAGIAVFIGVVQYGIFQVVAEIYYSAYGVGGYSVASNYISDLGANCFVKPCYIPPSSVIFNSSVALLGLLIIAGSYFLQKAFEWKPASVMVSLAGIGALGVGLFPETTGIWHSLFSLIVFLFAGLSAVVTARFQKKPMFYFSVILGLATLVALVLYVGSEYLGLGPGGMERMVVYPVLVWSVAFGGHLMAMDEPPRM